MLKSHVTDKDYYMDGFLKQNLDFIKEKTKKDDWDFIFLVDGREGSGKSILAQQMAYYLDEHGFNMDKIAFKPNDFKKSILKAEKRECIVYDEALSGLSVRQTLTYTNTAICSMLAEIRQKNLYIIIVCPTFFDLDKYVALWRSVSLLHVYTGDKLQRGFFSFFGYNNKIKLYVHGKKTYSYRKTNPNFRGRFYNFYTVNEKEYRAKKLLQLNKEDINVGLKYKAQRDRLIYFCHSKVGIRTGEITEAIGDITSRAIRYVLERERTK